MHELSIVFDILDQIEEIAKENHASEIKSLTLEIGEVSMVVPSYLEDCFKWACKKKEVTKNCKLKIEIIKAITICTNCNRTYDTLTFAKICPYCGSDKTYLLKGNEFNIKEIEVI